uniref:Uncharacterized protein n=1 Tax=Anopheles merus TaxID=30066 RepID=A0A182UYV8_ANOME
MLFSLLDSLDAPTSAPPPPPVPSFFFFFSTRSVAAELDDSEVEEEDELEDELLTLSSGFGSPAAPALAPAATTGAEFATLSPPPPATALLFCSVPLSPPVAGASRSSSFSQNPSLLTLDRLPPPAGSLPAAPRAAGSAAHTLPPGSAGPPVLSRSGTLSLLLLLLDEQYVSRSRCARLRWWWFLPSAAPARLLAPPPPLLVALSSTEASDRARRYACRPTKLLLLLLRVMVVVVVVGLLLLHRAGPGQHGGNVPIAGRRMLPVVTVMMVIVVMVVMMVRHHLERLHVALQHERPGRGRAGHTALPTAATTAAATAPTASTCSPATGAVFPRVPVLLEAGERAVVHRVRVLRVRDALDRVVLPVEVARLDRRLEPGEQLRIVAQVLLLLAAVRRRRDHVLRHPVQYLQVPGGELGVQHVPLVRREAGIEGGQPPQHHDLVAQRRARVLRRVQIAVRVAVLAAAAAAAPAASPVPVGADQQRELDVEPPDQYLVAGHHLLGDDLEQPDGVPVAPPVHLAHDREQVPHALRLAAPQRPQQRAPLGGGGRRRVGQVVHVAEHHRRRLAELEQDLLDVVVQRLLVQVPVGLVVDGGARGRVRRPAHRVDRGRLRAEQLVQQALRDRQYLLRLLADQILGELLQLVALQPGQRLGHGRAEAHFGWLLSYKRRSKKEKVVGRQVQLQDEIFRRSNVTATLYWLRGCVCTTVADRWNPIWSGSFTVRFLNSCSPRWNSSAELFARHEYSRMSSSLSGKLQKAMRSMIGSGTGGYMCSTSSNGMKNATHRAASSLLHTLSGSELQLHSESSSNRSESSKLNRSISSAFWFAFWFALLPPPPAAPLPPPPSRPAAGELC